MEFRVNEETPFLDIVYTHSGLSNAEIDSIKDYFNKSDSQDAIAGSSVKPDVRRSKVVWMHRDFNNKFQTNDIMQKIYNKVDLLNKEYFKFKLDFVEELQITKYDSNDLGFYRPHFDCCDSQGNITRKLSFVIHLSDPSEFEGGEFVYYNNPEGTVLNEEMPNAVQKGMIILFPSFLMHGVKPVTKGTRFSLVGWCNGERFK